MKMKNCSTKEFIKNLKGRKIVCFGAGATMLITDIKEKPIEHLEKHIAFFVDNDKKKQGQKFHYMGHDFEIKSADVLNELSGKDYVLLITCIYYTEVYRQLKDITGLKEMECYLYEMVRSHPELDVEEFFTKELEKKAFKDWREILSGYNLKNKHKGKRCFLIGNGPSLTAEDLDLLKGEITFASNRIYQLFDRTDWRPTYFFCIDAMFYRMDHEEINKVDAELRLVPLNRGLKAGKIYDEVTYYNRVADYAEVKNNQFSWKRQLRFSDDPEKVVYGGATVLYDAVQWAVYMGCPEIYLLGVDHNYKLEMLEDGTIVETDMKKSHFTKQYEAGIEKFAAPVGAIHLSWQQAKESCSQRGVIIKNATRGGHLEVFERVSLENLIRRDRG